MIEPLIRSFLKLKGNTLSYINSRANIDVGILNFYFFG